MNEQELRELDAWIAEHVFDWSDRVEVAKGRSLKSCGEFYTAFKEFKGSFCGDYSSHVMRDGAKVYCGEPFEFLSPPHYTTDRAAAMEALERCLTITEVHLMPPVESIFAIWGGGRRVQAESLPLAICLFAKNLFGKE